MDLKKFIKGVPDFPKKGILFQDITPILKDPAVFQYVIQNFARKHADSELNLIAGIESRGFIFGACLAMKISKGFVLVRKPGKLPGETVNASYAMEYGNLTVEIQRDAVTKGQRVLIVDDLLATGGTAAATAKLVEQLGGIVSGISFVVEITGLNGRDKLSGYDVHSMVTFD